MHSPHGDTCHAGMKYCYRAHLDMCQLLEAVFVMQSIHTTLNLVVWKGDPSEPVQRLLWQSLGPVGPIDAGGCSETGVPTQANCLVEQVI